MKAAWKAVMRAALLVELSVDEKAEWKADVWAGAKVA